MGAVAVPNDLGEWPQELFGGGAELVGWGVGGGGGCGCGCGGGGYSLKLLIMIITSLFHHRVYQSKCPIVISPSTPLLPHPSSQLKHWQLS